MVFPRKSTVSWAFVGFFFCVQVEAGIFDQLKGLISGNGIFDNFQETLKNLKKDDWNQVPCSEFANQDKEKLQEAESSSSSMSAKAVDCLKYELMKKENNRPTILSIFRDPSTTISEQLAVQENFDKPEEMTESTISEMGVTPLSRLSPEFLERVKDKNAIKKLVSNLDNALRSENNAMRKQKLQELRDRMVDKMADKVQDWRSSDVMGFDASKFAPWMIQEMPESLLDTRSVLEKFAEEAKRRPNCELGRELVSKLKKLKKIRPESSLAEKGKFFDDVADGLLKDYYFPEHLDTDLQDVTAIATTAAANWKKCSSNPKLSPISRALFRRVNNKKLTSSSDFSNLSPCGVATLTPSVVNSSLEFMNLQTMKQFDDCNIGADSNAKRMLMLTNQQKKMKEDTNKIYSSTLPIRVVESAQEFIKVPEGEARNILKLKDISLSQSQMEMLTSKITSPTEDLPADALATFTLPKVEKLSTSVLQRMGKKLPTTSLMNQELGRKLFGSKTSISYNVLIQNKENLAGMSRSDAKKIASDAPIFDMMRELRESRISAPLAIELRDRLADYLGKGDLQETVKKLSSVDLENMPMEVVASFGPWNLEKLDAQSKKVNMLRLGEMETADDIPAPLRKEIVRQGLGGQKTISAGSLISLGDAYMDIHPGMLRGADKSTKASFLKKLNMDIAKGKKRAECLTGDWIGSIREMMKSIKGYDMSKWMDVKNEGCLLWALDTSDLNAMNDAVLDGDFCEPPEVAATLREYDDESCKATPGNNFKHIQDRLKNVRWVQKKNIADEQKKTLSTRLAQTNTVRRKRQTVTQTPLERAAIMGVDSLSVSELEEVTPQEMLDWLPTIGSMEMSQSKAKVVAKKVLETMSNDVKKLTKENIRDMGKAFIGLDLDQVKELPNALFGTDSPAVGSLGLIDDWDSNKLEEVAKKVRQNINLISNLSPKDITNMNNILCGMSTTDLKIIRAQTFRESVGVFKNLDCDGNNLEEALPSLIEKGYGSADSMTSSQIADMGILVNAMSPQNIKDLEPSAYSGFSAKTMNNIETNLLKSMSMDGLENVPPQTAGLISSSQLNKLPEDMRKTLTSQFGYGSAAQGLGSLLLVTCLFLLTHWI